MHPAVTSAPGPSWSRRALLRSALAAAGAAGFARRVEGAAEEIVADVELPPEIGQTSLRVFVPDTGHTVRGTLLDYWRANGGAAVFGNPVSEPFAAPNGYYSQAFERGILQYRPDFLFTDEPIVRLMPIHGEVASSGLSARRRDGRRAFGGGHPRTSTWRPVGRNSASAARALSDGGVFFEETGHTLAGDLLAWYEAHEGHFYLGHPVSRVYRDRGRRAQLFEGGLLRSSDSAVWLESIDPAVLRRLDVVTTPVEQGDLPVFDESLFLSAPNPNPVGDPLAPGRKSLEISIGEQRLWAYQSSTVVSSTLVSTGLLPNGTEEGLFHVRLKYPEQDMRGFTDSTGEVLGLGGDAPSGSVPYAVDDVPNVMYFNLDAEALHGTYWHNNFGTPMSHGCVNLPLDAAAFLYGWAPFGTAVWVHP